MRDLDSGISAYMKGVSRFIDLPCEERITADMARSAANSEDSHQTIAEILNFRGVDDEDDDEQGDFFPSAQENLETRKGAELFRELSALTEEFASASAAQPNLFKPEFVIWTLAYYGIAMREACQILDAPDDLDKFSLAVAKRLQRDSAAIAERLRQVSSEVPGLRNFLEKQISRLARIRGKAIEICCPSRNTGK